MRSWFDVFIISEHKTRYKIISCEKVFFRNADFFQILNSFFLCHLEKGGNAKSKKRFVNLFSDWQLFHSNIYIYCSFCSPAVFCSLELSLGGDLEVACIFRFCCLYVRVQGMHFIMAIVSYKFAKGLREILEKTIVNAVSKFRDV